MNDTVPTVFHSIYPLSKKVEICDFNTCSKQFENNIGQTSPNAPQVQCFTHSSQKPI